MGKGMPAALLMATARAALRAVSDEALAERAVSRAAAALAMTGSLEALGQRAAYRRADPESAKYIKMFA